MSNPVFDRYKIPFLFSIVVSLAIIVLPGQVTILNSVLAVAGSILGFFLIDLEYLIHAYLVDPSSDVSLHIKDYMARHDYIGLIDFYNKEEYMFGELSIRSVMFQVLLAALALMSITNHSWIFARGMILTMSITLLYFQFEEFIKTGTLQRWFWVYKGNLYSGFYRLYMAALLIFFVYQFVFL